MAKKHKSGSRKRESLIESTASVRATLAFVFERIGGVAALVHWAKKNPGDFYKLWSRLHPQEIHAELTDKEGVRIESKHRVETTGPIAKRNLVRRIAATLKPELEM